MLLTAKTVTTQAVVQYLTKSRNTCKKDLLNAYDHEISTFARLW
jgi:hypothetical protein